MQKEIDFKARLGFVRDKANWREAEYIRGSTLILYPFISFHYILLSLIVSRYHFTIETKIPIPTFPVKMVVYCEYRYLKASIFYLLKN